MDLILYNKRDVASGSEQYVELTLAYFYILAKIAFLCTAVFQTFVVHFFIKRITPLGCFSRVTALPHRAILNVHP